MRQLRLPPDRIAALSRLRGSPALAGRHFCCSLAGASPARRSSRRPGRSSARAGHAAAAAAARPSGPLEVDITQGTLKPIPIAVPEFLGEDPQLRRSRSSDVVAADLERSGLFQPLDRASFIDRSRDLNAAAALSRTGG